MSKLLKKLLIRIFLWIHNRRSNVTFFLTGDSKNVLLTKKRLKHLPAVGDMVMFNDIIMDNDTVAYRVLSVAHQITKGHKVTIQVEKV